MEKYPTQDNSTNSTTKWDTLGQDEINTFEDIKTFWENKKDEINDTINPILDKISQDDYIYAVNAYDLSKNVGDQSLIDIVSRALDMAPPSFSEDFSLDSVGGYVFGRNKILLNREKLKQNLQEEGIGQEEMPFHELGTIAHETWHAHQEQVARKGGDRSDIYREGIKNYKDSANFCENDDWSYYGQIIELEAEYFGYRIGKELRKAANYLDEIDN